jgi:hypothetical protein
MRRVAGLVAAAGVLFVAGFALAQGAFTVSLAPSIGSTDASFAYSTPDTANFFCSFTVTDQACGTSTTSGSTTYAVSPGTYTFGVRAEAAGIDVRPSTASAGTTFAIAAAPPPSVSVSTLTVTTFQPTTVTQPGATITKPGVTVPVTVTTDTGGGVSAPTAIAVVVGFVGVLAATATWLTVRWRRRSGWQARATTAGPPTHCAEPAHWCTSEVKLKPGSRNIAYLQLAGQGLAAQRLGGRSRGKAVDALNGAVRDYRGSGSADEIRLAVTPAAAELLGEIRAQVEEGANGVAAVAAHLDGGKASCKYTVYRCVGNDWKPRDSWEVEIDDERDEPVAQVALPLHDGSLELLVDEFAGFITKVDVR